MLKTIAAVAVTAALIDGFSAAVSAATGSLSVSATVSNNCTVNTSILGFGPYDPVLANASTSVDGSGTVTVACTKGAVSTIGLGPGSNASGGTRRMTDASSNFLTYELYMDPGRATVWGSGGAGLVTTPAPSKLPRTFTVYGRLTGSHDIPSGTYTDTVLVTVDF